MLFVALVLVADLDSAPRHGPRVRPAECNVLPGERGANVWERAKIPELRRYCDLVASATAKLAPGSRMVPDVVLLADQADALVPGRAAPMLVKGRALCQLARYSDALAALRAAEGRDERALDEPAALLAWARSLAFTGDAAGARAAYRALLPRAEALPLADRGVAYLGAGMLAMAAGPSGLDETIAILRQARRDSQDLLRAAATFALALALDRAGDGGEALAVLAEEGAGEAPSVMEDARVLAAMGPGAHAEARAIEALAAGSAGKREVARAKWREVLAEAGESGAWAAHARAHEVGEGARPAGASRHP